MLSFLYIFIHSVCSKRILGVPPSMEEKYSKNIDEKAQTFTCFSDSKKIPLSKLNDNYKDCDDGSDEPGSSLGPTAFNFYCLNEKYIPLEIPRWSVGDGICDCCDASDETFNTHSNCNNTCSYFEEQIISIRQHLTKIYQQGIEQRKELEAQGSQEIEAGRKKTEKYQTKIDRYQRKIQKIKSGKKTPTPLPTPVIPDEFGSWENDEEKSEQVDSIEAANSGDNSTESNTTKEVRQENSKPTPTPIPTPIIKPKKKLSLIENIWRFVFLIDRNDVAFSEVFMRQKDGRVKLYKSKISGWEEKKKKVNLISDFIKDSIPSSYYPIYGKEFTNGDFTISFMKEIKQSSTNLGKYKTFASTGNTTSFFYNNGAYCWETKSGRKTEVKVYCSNENKFVSLVEPKTCEYSAIFTTPAACSNEDLTSLSNMTLEQLQEMQNIIGVENH
ncbi:hypothetical protein M9Y10_041122 [Tritrichomonas musculus]|uniref:Glucosidase 2 subunit beta n=1 Tax=Tritrichomonas musculus TaxID=1915356 RepID=A0ABR2K3I0_9EUKA